MLGGRVGGHLFRVQLLERDGGGVGGRGVDAAEAPVGGEEGTGSGEDKGEQAEDPP